MKKIVILLLIITQNIFSQQVNKIDLLNKMSQATCECLEAAKVDNSNLRETAENCINSALTGNKKLINSLYDDKFNDDEKGLLSKLTLKTVYLICPKTIKKLDSIAMSNYNSPAVDSTAVMADSVAVAVDTIVDSTDAITQNQETGKYISTKFDGLFFLNILTDNGLIKSFVMLDYFQNSDLIRRKKLKLQKEIEVEYYEKEIYNPKLNSYRSYKILIDVNDNLETSK
jgi:hypothetical protein